MSDDQRAMVAGKLANMPHGGDRKSGNIKVSIGDVDSVSRTDAATLLNVPIDELVEYYTAHVRLCKPFWSRLRLDHEQWVERQFGRAAVLLLRSRVQDWN